MFKDRALTGECILCLPVRINSIGLERIRGVGVGGIGRLQAGQVTQRTRLFQIGLVIHMRTDHR